MAKATTTRSRSRRPAWTAVRMFRPDDLQSHAQRRHRHGVVDGHHHRERQQHPPVDGRVRQPREAVFDGEGGGLRHGGQRIVERDLDEDIGETDTQKAHHQGRDDLVDAELRLEESGNERPGGAHGHGHGKAHGHHQERWHCAREFGRQGRRHHGGEKELTVHAQVPQTAAKGHDQSGGDSAAGAPCG